MGDGETVSLVSLILVVWFLSDIRFHSLCSLFTGTCSWLQFFEGGLFDIFTYIHHTLFRKGFKAIMSSHPGSKQFLL